MRNVSDKPQQLTIFHCFLQTLLRMCLLYRMGIRSEKEKSHQHSIVSPMHIQVALRCSLGNFHYLINFIFFIFMLIIAPTITWKRLDNNETLKPMSSSKLVLSALTRSDKGVYSCIAENKHGSSMTNFTINIQCEHKNT